MKKNTTLFSQAKRYIPGGVNSPVRAFKSVAGVPIFFERGKGAYLYSAEGKRYIDYVGSWGPMILGHAHPAVLEAICDASAHGWSFGAPTELEIHLAQKVCTLMPAIEKVRMVNSGTEAAMSAIRLARAYTGRDKIVKFNGCYHGHADSLLVKMGSGGLTFGIPDSPGVPAMLARQTLNLEYNNIEQAEKIFLEYAEDIAAIIVEPIAGNMGCVLPHNDFLQKLRALADEHHAVLIFDEVMTGFRVALGGAQSLYNIQPDLTLLGKVLGGGLPVGAFGGRAEIMDHIAPEGAVYQAGTLSGNPLAMAAGLKTLELISSDSDFFEMLEQKNSMLIEGLHHAFAEAGIDFSSNHVGGMFGLFFSSDIVIDSFAKVLACDLTFFKNFFHAVLEEGIYIAPSAFESGFISAAHSAEDINETIDAVARALKKLAIQPSDDS